MLRCNYHINNKILSYGENIKAAKTNGLPIVALESTIITHGMPYPHNLATALEAEDIIRQKGVIPATIAVVNGKIKVGINKKEIERLAKSERKNLVKISRRDLSYAISNGLSGGTTVSATMFVAKKANIPIMATGGIGGVHRYVEFSMDISADLKELGQTSVAVVCSGVKSIMDVSKTLEYLESEGVPVVTIGTNLFPAFYSQQTVDGIKSPMQVSNAKEAGALIATQMQLGLDMGILLAVPVPEPYSIEANRIEAVLEQALDSAGIKNISGKDVTPFLLSELTRLTSGRSLETNKVLLKENAAVAADIALHLHKIQNNFSVSDATSSNSSKPNENPVVIGGATFDTILRVKELEIKFNGSTHKGESYRTCGGVGRNLAAALINLGMADTKLLSVIGDDEAGRAITHSLGSASSTIRILPDISTARYTAVIDNKGNCCFGVGEMNAFMKINKEFLQQNRQILENAPLLVIDGNPSLDAMEFALDICLQNQIPVWYEPTDINKALKIFECGPRWQQVLHFISPNVNELMAIAKHLQIPIPSNESNTDFEIVKKTSEFLAQRIPVVITTLGEQGVLITRKSSANELLLDKNNDSIESSAIQSRLYPPLNFAGEIISVSGCGDCLAAGIITGILKGWKESDCVSLGLLAAKQSLTSHETVPNQLNLLSVNQS
ncbi:PREDICTED: pseudouridine-metabolizing bifunctional protein C1861.05 [Ceratosolen solmsi marchali]|uniref:Pseudouridine-metabolizing bifunctional protein C1861.05 n=1 Tax=Ceratosolen solmsi marchali TaxID=326594 RepID=A0AAJ7E2L4_9HYME|nr:PREDICTED: pseudouridine-metabolizing bifunctional protein C1861.05 [Ceratosolen solmsi marchali]